MPSVEEMLTADVNVGRGATSHGCAGLWTAALKEDSGLLLKENEKRRAKDVFGHLCSRAKAFADDVAPIKRVWQRTRITRCYTRVKYPSLAWPGMAEWHGQRISVGALTSGDRYAAGN
jgi:hypothetical protein